MNTKSNMELLEIDILFHNLDSKDDKIRFEAFTKILKLTEQQVDWIYDKWYLLADKLKSDNSYQRTIGLKLIANLCKSDNENHILEILDDCLALINDEKFITARQCIQSIWQIALINKGIMQKIIKELESTYLENVHINKHGNLIKQDIIGCLLNIYKITKNKEILLLIHKLMDSETDEKLIKALKKIIKN